MRKLWNRIVERFWHYYWEGITGEQCWECSGLKEYLRKQRPTIMAIQRQYVDPSLPRYGCPQDYDNAEDFIKDL